MWKDQSLKRHYWAGVGAEVKDLAKALTRVEMDEEVDGFLLNMHLKNKSEKSVFTVEEQNQIDRMLSLLIKDSKRHQKTAERISKV